MFKESVKCVSRMYQESLKDVNGCLREVSKVFQGRFKGVTESVKCVSRKFYKKFQRCFRNLSMKFCFTILL